LFLFSVTSEPIPFSIWSLRCLGSPWSEWCIDWHICRRCKGQDVYWCRYCGGGGDDYDDDDESGAYYCVNYGDNDDDDDDDVAYVHR